jgi:hypothetical protein
VSNIPAGKTVFFKVVAVDSSGTEGTYSNEVSVTTVSTTGTIAKPTITSGTITSTSIKITWNFPVGAAGFNIYISETGTAGSFVKQNSDGVYTGISWTVTGLTNNTHYYFQVVAVNTNLVEGTYSDTKDITTSSSKSIDKLEAISSDVVSDTSEIDTLPSAVFNETGTLDFIQ